MQIQKLSEESPLLREKCKGDALVESGMYVHAIQVYQKLLKEDDLETVREGFTESVCSQSGLCLQLSLPDGKSGRMFPESL